MTQVSLCRETAVWPWEQAGGSLTQQTSIYALVANLKKNVEVVLKKSQVFFGASLVAFKLPNAEEAARCSIFLVSFGENLDNMGYNWLSNKQFALNILYAAK